MARLSSVLAGFLASAILETDAVDVPGPQPPYLNAAVVGETTLAPQDLLSRLLALERARGRERTTLRAPRTLDLDLILYGDLVIDSPALVVPHPRFRDRRFVLEPLAEIARDMRDPLTGQTVGELLGKLPAART
jgi:2-amino-4-hydroxy-6-hydroxymethyldihydropteridine diphosphokinase